MLKQSTYVTVVRRAYVRLSVYLRALFHKSEIRKEFPIAMIKFLLQKFLIRRLKKKGYLTHIWMLQEHVRILQQRKTKIKIKLIMTLMPLDLTFDSV